MEKTNPTTNIRGIEGIRKMMNSITPYQAEMLHFWFERVIVDNSSHDFLDEWFIEAYITAYNDYFCFGEITLEQMNENLCVALDKWKTEEPYVYRKGMRLLKSWVQDEIFFNIDCHEEIELKKIRQRIDAGFSDYESDKQLFDQIKEFPIELLKIADKGKIKVAVPLCHYLFVKLAETQKMHEAWFEAKNSVLTDLMIMTDVCETLYSHIRINPKLTLLMKYEMDARIEIMQMKYSFFEESSAYWDMLQDEKDQFGDYKDLKENKLWQAYLDKVNKIIRISFKKR